MVTRKSCLLSASVVVVFFLGFFGALNPNLVRRGLFAAELSTAQQPTREVLAIRKSRVTLAQKGYDSAAAALQHTTRHGNTLVMDGRPADVYEWSVRWLKAERELNPTLAEHLGALQAHLKRMTALESAVGGMSKDLMPERTRLDAEWYRLEAQLWFEEEKSKQQAVR